MNDGSISECCVGKISRRERERQQRRTDILRSAERIFAERGFHAASIEEIARSAEFASGTVYLYFKDKEALYIELFEQKVRELSEWIHAEIRLIEDPVEALTVLIRTRMSYFERNRAFFRIYCQEGISRMESRQPRWMGVVALYEQYLARISDLVRTGQQRGMFREGDPHQYAVALSGMMIQLTREWLASQDESVLASRTGFIVDIFLNGVRTR